MALDISLERGIYLTVSTNIAKSDCMSIDESVAYLKVSKPELYSFLTILNIGRHRFPRDRKTYIAKADIASIKALLQRNAPENNEEEE